MRCVQLYLRSTVLFLFQFVLALVVGRVASAQFAPPQEDGKRIREVQLTAVPSGKRVDGFKCITCIYAEVVVEPGKPTQIHLPGEWEAPHRRPHPSALAFEKHDSVALVFAQVNLEPEGELFIFYARNGNRVRGYQLKFIPFSENNPADHVVKIVHRNMPG